MDTMPQERHADIKSLMLAIRRSDQGFSNYHSIYRVYKHAVRSSATVERLIEINDSYRESKRECRKAFSAMRTVLDDINAKYATDAMGDVFASIRSQIAGWNLDSVTATAASQWMKAFNGRLMSLRSMRNFLNGSPKRQQMIRELAISPFPSDLPPVSRIAS